MGTTSLETIAVALRDVTEILAREISNPSDTPPLWGDFEWSIARAAATIQGISPLLHSALQWDGPVSWHQFLAAQKEHVARRHLRIAELLICIDAAARTRGAAVLALKGAALHAMGLYQPGERPMADIDLLARDEDTNTVTQLLQDCGFEATLTTWRHQAFEPSARMASHADFGEHADNPIKIELHTSIRERLPLNETDITSYMFPHKACPGINGYRSPASMMAHLLLHAAGNMRAHALRHIQLNDIARLGGRFSSSDWDELLRIEPSDRAPWWALPPLMITARYYPSAIPSSVVGRLESVCPWLLRKATQRQRLSDVSWSNIKVYAFPGIEWASTPLEAIQFVASRVWPSREALSELRQFVARDPNATQVPWYGISHPARILRWIFFRPPRVQTLLAVRAALAEVA